MTTPPHTRTWDWYPGSIPANSDIHGTAYIETTFSFTQYRSRLARGFYAGRGASAYLGTMFDVGERGHVSLGNFALVHGARIICDLEVTIGDYSLISWNVVIMDTYRVPANGGERRAVLERVSRLEERLLSSGGNPRAVTIGRNVWIGFDACILPGVVIGEGAVVGAKSVVASDVEPYTVVAGNPARIVRHISVTAAAIALNSEGSHVS